MERSKINIVWLQKLNGKVLIINYLNYHTRNMFFFILGLMTVPMAEIKKLTELNRMELNRNVCHNSCLYFSQIFNKNHTVPFIKQNT